MSGQRRCFHLLSSLVLLLLAVFLSGMDAASL